MRLRRHYKLGLSLLNQALEMRKSILPSDHPLIAQCYNSIAETHRTESRYKGLL
jgi:hypothetical protein